MIAKYYWLTKPGIFYGNALTAVAGFFLAAGFPFDWQLPLSMLAGLWLVIASSCVFNNILDRDMDARMDRTKKRSLVTGSISPKNALIFAATLGILGLALFFFLTNLLTTIIALIGMLTYVLIYTPLKRKSWHATLVGTIPGSTPPVIGYVSATGQFDQIALLLFLILVTWQMAHFYAIAIFRLQEYRSASIPILPAVKSILFTKINIIIYIIIYIIITSRLNYIASVFGIIWLILALHGFRKNIDDVLWAKGIFRFSLIVLTAFSLSLTINAIINL